MTFIIRLKRQDKPLEWLFHASNGALALNKTFRGEVTYLATLALQVTCEAFRAPTNRSSASETCKYPDSYSTATMLPRPSVLRTAQFATKQPRSSFFRNTIQRRFASHESPKLVGPMDNAFNRERLAVKEHAKQSTGMSSIWRPASMCSLAYFCDHRTLAETLHLVGSFQEQDRRFYTLTDGSVVIPALLIASINAKNLWDEHWEHWEHLPPLEERVEYPYQNIRTKAFPWGDGDKVSQPQSNRSLLFKS